jgi:hypothetical protein
MQRRTAMHTALICTVALSLAACATSNPQADTSPTGPSTSHCGHVTSEQGVPPQDQDLYEAFITQIDGRSTNSASRHLVEVGKHTLTVSEEIPPNHLNSAALAQIFQMKRREDARAYKHLEVDVQPGVTYRIGARLLRDKLDDASIDANAYWEPVVWDTLVSKCP